MNFLPYTIYDNFLRNPDTIKNWALTLNYTSPPVPIFPGKRTECLSKINPSFFHHYNSKILSLFFSNDVNYEFNAITQFHLSKDIEEKGWIHQDPAIFTALLYLSDEDPNVNRGTSLYEMKPDVVPGEANFDFLNSIKYEQYGTGKIDKEKNKIKEDYENNNFNKILDIKDKYNRIFCFDSSGEIFHSSNNHSSPSSKERLTLITFINEVRTNEMFPIVKSRRQSNL